jgi:hypothetical protein
MTIQNIDTSLQNKSSWLFFLFWIIATVIGAVLGFAMSLNIGNRLPASPIASVIILALFSVNFAGIVATCLQWIVLSIFIKRSIAWLVTGSIGWCFPFAAILLLFVHITGQSADLIAAGGLTAGFLQWLVMRKWMPRAGWWVLANTIGWSLVVVFLSHPLPLQLPPVWGYWSMLPLPFFPGIITGVTMMVLMKSAHTSLNPSVSAA